MKQYIYADGVANISLAGGMVRLDLFHYDGNPTEGQHELPKSVDQQLVMQPVAFMRAFESMQRFVAELEKNGLVHRSTVSQPTRPQNTENSAVSPNFE